MSHRSPCGAAPWPAAALQPRSGCPAKHEGAGTLAARLQAGLTMAPPAQPPPAPPGGCKRAIVWLRRDLRLADNPALTAALRLAPEVVRRRAAGGVQGFLAPPVLCSCLAC